MKDSRFLSLSLRNQRSIFLLSVTSLVGFFCLTPLRSATIQAFRFCSDAVDRALRTIVGREVKGSRLLQNFKTHAPDQSDFYSPLRSATSFRLLRLLHPGDSAKGHELCFALEEYELDECPDFQALSYTWSPPYRGEHEATASEPVLNFSPRIIVDGRPFAVTRNMVDALTFFASSAGERHVWIDGVCISQRDLSERAAQVLLMSSIYSKALEVLVWLGGYHPCQKHFIWTVNEYMSGIQDLMERQGRDYVLEKSPESRILANDLGITDPREYQQGAIKFYRKCRWFHRAWVVQETVLAQGFRVFCGKAEISVSGLKTMGDCFSTPVWAIYEQGDAAGPGYALVKEGRQGIDARFMLEIRDWHRDGKKSFDHEDMILRRVFPINSELQRGLAWFFQLVYGLRVTQCSDRRDKIFSVVGMASKYFPGPIENYLRPDYTKPIGEVYAEFTTILLHHIGSLNVLTFVNDPTCRTIESLPSWVSDYSSANMPPPFLFRAAGHGFKFDVLGGKQMPGLDPVVSPAVLACNGTLICTVTETAQGNTYVASGPGRGIFLSLLQMCASFSTYANGQNRVEALWRTVCSDTSIEGEHPAPDSFSNSFYITFLIEEAVRLAMTTQKGISKLSRRREIESVLFLYTTEIEARKLPSLQDISDIAEYESAYLSGTEEDRAAMQDFREALRKTGRPFFQAMSLHSGGRWYFRTARNFLGTGPPSTQANDQIWVLKDCQIPMVLRPKPEKDTFTVIGECYLHGFMNGEAFDPKWKIEEKVRRIRLV